MKESFPLPVEMDVLRKWERDKKTDTRGLIRKKRTCPGSASDEIFSLNPGRRVDL
jgi:hypothetical protein